MAENNKKYLFIEQYGKENIRIETFIIDSDGNRREGSINLELRQIGNDTRIPLVETAIQRKIKIHHKFEANQFILRKNLKEVFEELIAEKGNRLTIFFDIEGHDPTKTYIYFDKEDKEIDFYFSQITNEAYQTLKTNIEKAIWEPLSNFNEIYIFENLLIQNGLFQLLKEEEWSNRIVTKNLTITIRKEELRGLKVWTNREKKKKEEALKEKEAFEELEKIWNDGSLRDKIEACSSFKLNYPNSSRNILVEPKLKGFQDDEAWEKADNIKIIEAYERYLIYNKGGLHEVDAQKAIKEIDNIAKRKEVRSEDIKVTNTNFKFKLLAGIALLLFVFFILRGKSWKTGNVSTDKPSTEKPVKPISLQVALLQEQKTFYEDNFISSLNAVSLRGGDYEYNKKTFLNLFTPNALIDGNSVDAYIKNGNFELINYEIKNDGAIKNGDGSLSIGIFYKDNNKIITIIEKGADYKIQSIE